MCQVMQEFTATEIVGNDRFHTDLFRFYIQALFVPGGVVVWCYLDVTCHTLSAGGLGMQPVS